MHPLLSSDFGNLAAFIFGVPALLFGLMIEIPSWFFGAPALARACGAVCVVVGVLFLLSLPAAKDGDGILTIVFSLVSVIAGLALALIKRKKKE